MTDTIKMRVTAILEVDKNVTPEKLREYLEVCFLDGYLMSHERVVSIECSKEESPSDDGEKNGREDSGAKV